MGDSAVALVGEPSATDGQLSPAPRWALSDLGAAASPGWGTTFSVAILLASRSGGLFSVRFPDQKYKKRPVLLPV